MREKGTLGNRCLGGRVLIKWMIKKWDGKHGLD